MTDSKSIYILMLIYGASTATTTLACIAVILGTPVTSAAAAIATNAVSITPDQRFLLLSSYVPFFVVPFVMTVDMAMRVLRLVNTGIATDKARKIR